MTKAYDTAICRILRKSAPAPDIVDITVEAGALAEQAKPGQFAHVFVPGKTLRRPISICDADKEQGTLRLVFQVRGEGTRALAALRPGETMDILAPLGHGFMFENVGKRAVFVGGGIGVPPLLFAARQCGAESEAILGFRSAPAVILAEDFAAAGCDTTVMTDDGSAGRHGFTTERLEEVLKNGEAGSVFACGPTAMLRRVAQLAEQYGVPCQVSLEERMGCGVGACLVCACKTKRADAMGGYSHVCKDGPVFLAQEVDWQ